MTRLETLMKEAAARSMSHITIPVSDELLGLLRQRAESTGVTAEEFVRRHVEQLMDQPDDQFRDAAAYVMRKNAELYRRLA